MIKYISYELYKREINGIAEYSGCVVCKLFGITFKRWWGLKCGFDDIYSGWVFSEKYAEWIKDRSFLENILIQKTGKINYSKERVL